MMCLDVVKTGKIHPHIDNIDWRNFRMPDGKTECLPTSRNKSIQLFKTTYPRQFIRYIVVLLRFLENRNPPLCTPWTIKYTVWNFLRDRTIKNFLPVVNASPLPPRETYFLLPFSSCISVSFYCILLFLFYFYYFITQHCRGIRVCT